MAKYREGQEVRILANADKIRSKINFNPYMKEFLGQKVTIESQGMYLSECCYEVRENNWSWAEVWLEEISLDEPGLKVRSLKSRMAEITDCSGHIQRVDIGNVYGYCGGDLIGNEKQGSMWHGQNCIIGGSQDNNKIWLRPVSDERDFKYSEGSHKFILLAREGFEFSVGDILPDGREILVINPHTEECYVSDPERESMDDSSVGEDWWPNKYRGANIPYGQWLTEDAMKKGMTDSGSSSSPLPLSGMIISDEDLKKIALVFLSRFNDAMRRGHTIIVPSQDCILSEGHEDIACNRIGIEASDGVAKQLSFRVEEKHLDPEYSLRSLGVTLYHLALGQSEVNDESFISEGYEGRPLASKLWPVIRQLLRGRENDTRRSEQMLLRIR